MAINWIVALKAVPWTDLVQAAPGIVKGARKLFADARANPARASARGAANASTATGTSVEARLAQLETQLEILGEEQRASADLIRSLADQHARVVQAMTVLQARTRVLLGVCIALAVALTTLAIWVVTR
jgi:hypothetical protein